MQNDKSNIMQKSHPAGGHPKGEKILPCDWSPEG